MRILAIGAHPDDIEVYCGGTLSMYMKRGHEVIMVTVTRGDKGHKFIEPVELSAIRMEESRNAGNIIGARVINAGLGDLELQEDLKNRNIIVDVIRKANPDVIITHTPDDYHADHKVVSNLTVDASFIASVPGIKTEYEAMGKIPHIYFMESYTGINFQPQEYVDITEVFSDKIEMMKQHKSQLEFLKDHDNMDILDYIENTARFRGFQCGVKYAEGFIRYSSALRISPGRFLP